MLKWAMGAALAATATLAPSVVNAQDRVVTRERVVVHQERRHLDNGRHNGWRWRNSCHWEWRHHARVKICRRVRYHW